MGGGAESRQSCKNWSFVFCFLFFKPCVNKTVSQQELFRHFTGRRLTGWREATSRRPENSRLCQGGTAKHVNRKGGRPGEVVAVTTQGRRADERSRDGGSGGWSSILSETVSNWVIRLSEFTIDSVCGLPHCRAAPQGSPLVTWSHSQLCPEATSSIWNRAASWDNPACCDLFVFLLKLRHRGNNLLV